MKWDHSLINTLEWGNQISHKEDKTLIPQHYSLTLFISA